MIRVLVLSIILCVFTFVILIGAAVVVGHGQPPSLAVQQLHLLDCALPCWIGIVPGKTSADDALRRFGDVFWQLEVDTIIKSSSNFTSSFLLPVVDQTNYSSNVLVSLEFFEEIVDYTMIQQYGAAYIATGMPSVGDVINLLGDPSCASPPSPEIPRWSFIFYMPAGNVEVSVNGGDAYLSWIKPISDIVMRLPVRVFTGEPCPSDVQYYPWQGLHRGNYPEERPVVSP